MRDAMRCEDFDRGLEDLLASNEDPGDREPLLASLRHHAAACPRCGSARALIDWAGPAQRSRDPVEDPGAAYWAGFDARLARAVALSRRRRALAWGLGAPAAAAILAGIALVARPGPAEPPPPVAPPASETAEESAWTEDLAPADAWAQDADTGEWLFPSIDGLDDEDRRRLADWLEAEESRIGGGPA